VPLGDSIQANRVLRYVRTLAAVSHGQVKLVRATDIEDETSFNSLAANAARMQDSGISVEWSVVSGVDATTAIGREVSDWQPDLIAMTSRSTSAVDRWLNGSVTDEIVRAVSVPVLVVPPNWLDVAPHERPLRILVPVDGSRSAEQALDAAVRLAILLSAEIILLRAVRAESHVNGANEYLRLLSAELESVLPDGRLDSVIVHGAPAKAITRAASDLEVDAIAMATHGRGGLARALSDSTATTVLEHSEVPLLLFGPYALVERASSKAHRITLRGPVRTRDHRLVGEVHRVVVDLEQRAVVSVVVLGRDRLARDIVIPIDFIERLDESEVRLQLTAAELDNLPDFSHPDYVTPPSTWTSVPPAAQRERIGQHQQVVTRESQVVALDGHLGHVDGLEVDSDTGELMAFLVHTNVRLPAEYVQASDEEDKLCVNAMLADIDGFLGHS
jgi:nucleotide-binding universal stress UspA family protein